MLNHITVGGLKVPKRHPLGPLLADLTSQSPVRVSVTVTELLASTPVPVAVIGFAF